MTLFLSLFLPLVPLLVSYVVYEELRLSAPQFANQDGSTYRRVTVFHHDFLIND